MDWKKLLAYSKECAVAFFTWFLLTGLFGTIITILSLQELRALAVIIPIIISTFVLYCLIRRRELEEDTDGQEELDL